MGRLFATVGYDIPDVNLDNQNGTLIIPENVAITASNPGQVNINQIAAMRVDHIGFLRVYFVDGTNNKIIYEPWQNTLSDRLSSIQIYQSHNPEGFPGDYLIYKISMEVIDYIRYLLYALMHLHKKNYCVDGDFTIDNVVISNGMAKFKGLGVRPIKKEQEVDQVRGNYTNFRRLVNRILTYTDFPCQCQTPEDSRCPQHSKCPADMRYFLDLLLDPIGNETLIMYHCALWTSRQKLGYLQSFHDDWPYLPPNTQIALGRRLDSIYELRNWRNDAAARDGSPLHRVYRVYRGFDHPPDIRDHFKFLRDYIAHVSEHVDRAQYNLNFVERVLTATYPLSLCFLLESLHEVDSDALIESLPKELEKVLQ